MDPRCIYVGCAAGRAHSVELGECACHMRGGRQHDAGSQTRVTAPIPGLRSASKPFLYEMYELLTQRAHLDDSSPGAPSGYHAALGQVRPMTFRPEPRRIFFGSSLPHQCLVIRNNGRWREFWPQKPEPQIDGLATHPFADILLKFACARNETRFLCNNVLSVCISRWPLSRLRLSRRAFDLHIAHSVGALRPITGRTRQ